jgi:hypothetical protein
LEIKIKSLILTLALTLALSFLTSCGPPPRVTTVPNPLYTPEPAVPAYTGPEVVYQIFGTAVNADITLRNASGATEQYDKLAIPNQFVYDSFPSRYVYISAQNHYDSGSVKVIILVNGEIYKEGSSSGAYVIASASGYK